MTDTTTALTTADVANKALDKVDAALQALSSKMPQAWETAVSGVQSQGHYAILVGEYALLAIALLVLLAGLLGIAIACFEKMHESLTAVCAFMMAGSVLFIAPMAMVAAFTMLSYDNWLMAYNPNGYLAKEILTNALMR